MPRLPLPLIACALLAGSPLRAESSEYPLAINLPTTERMQFWDLGLAFTHRFVAPAQGHGRDAFGLDGFTYAGLGVTFGIKPVKGLNATVYRTADNKTLTFALQHLLLDTDRVRLALRAERFDEVVPRASTALGSVGISGGVFQVPTDIYLTDDIVVALVPTYLSRTTTQEKAVFNVGAGLRIAFTDKFSFFGEYYPRPAKVDKSFETAFAAGISYKTFKHRFSLFGSNAVGTTAHQVLGGDYGGLGKGPRPKGDWAIGFNVARVF